MRHLFYFLSRRQLQLGLLIVMLLWSATVSAERVTATFENGLPEGWTAVGDISINNDRARTGKGVWTYSKAEKTNYVLTTEIDAGEIELYARSYNKNGYGYITLYTVDGDNKPSEKLTEIRTEKVSYGQPSFTKYTYTLPARQRIAIDIYWAAMDDFTYTPYVQSAGASMAVKIANEEQTAGGSYDFGLVEAGGTAKVVVDNNGTTDYTLTMATTGGYTVSPATATLKAGGQQELTLTMPNASAEGTLMLTSSDQSLEAFTLNLSCTVKDPEKMFIDFSDGLPEQWESVGLSDYYSDSYAWTATNGYAATSAGSESYAGALVSTPMTFEDGEKLFFSVQKYGSSTFYTPSVAVHYLVGNSWKFAGTPFTDMTENEWTQCAVTIPATATKIRFFGWYVKIDNIYGGKLLPVAPKPKLAVEGIANGGSLSWGFADVPAGTEKTITLKNDGKAELNVAFSVTDDYTLSAAEATVAAGGTYDLTIGTPAHDGNGVLTITPDAESGLSPYLINLTSYYKVPKAVMTLDKTSIAFGKVYADASDTILVQNTGDAELTVTVENDLAARFELSASTLTVPVGESRKLAVKYKYDANISGIYTANIKLTPNDGSAKTIQVSANNKRMGVWTEDFEEGIPASWTNDGWTVDRKYNEERTVNHAFAGRNSGYLITPRLKAQADEELTFDYVSHYSTLKVEWAQDAEAKEWTLVGEIEQDSTVTFKAPAAGIYYLRFSGEGSYIDNFEGFQLDLLAADIAIIGNTLPTTGKQYATYTADVTIQNKGTDAQTLVARLMVNGQTKDTKEGALAIEGTTRLQLSFTPEEALENAIVRIEVTLKDVADFEAKIVEAALTIAPALVISETAATELSLGKEEAVVVRYTAQQGYNTIAMPFELTADMLSSLFGDDFAAYEFKGVNKGKLIFKETTAFYAGYPYVVMATTLPQQQEQTVWKNVEIKTTAPRNDSYSDATVQAVFEPMAAGTLTGKYLISATGVLEAAKAETTLAGYRAYIELPEGVTTATLEFQDSQGVPTRIIEMVPDASMAVGSAYNLSGRKVSNAQRGLRIVNGKKTLFK